MSSSDGGELRVGRLEDVVVLVETRDGTVRRDLDDVEVVDLDELLLLRLRGAGHARELLVEAEVVLERDRRERDVLLADARALLRLDRLVQTLAPATALHDPARELVDDLDLALLHDVVDVAPVQRLRLERLHEVVDQAHVAWVVEVVDADRALDLLDRRLRRRDRLELLVVEVVGTRELRLVEALRRLPRRGCALEVLHDARELIVGRGRRLRLAGDDERRARLVDEDRVDLVHDRVRVASLDDVVERDRHVVAQVVEPELRVRPVRDVARIRLAALRERHEVLDGPDGAAELLVHRPRPLGIALRQVVVDRDEVDAAARESVEVERLHCDERLSLAGLHLRDVALVQDDPAHELYVEEADADRAPERLAYRRVGLEQEVFERLPVLEPLLELGGLPAELLVRQLLEVGLERADVRSLLGEALDAAPLAHAQDALELPERGRGHGPRVPARLHGIRGRTRSPGAGSLPLVHRLSTGGRLASRTWRQHGSSRSRSSRASRSISGRRSRRRAWRSRSKPERLS